jgi:hypothetical protein
MSQSYTDELAEWAQQRALSARRHKNLAAFLLVKDDARAAVQQGWPVMAIWSHMYEKKRITFGYETFLHYVKRYIHRDVRPAPAAAAVPLSTSPAAAPEVTDGAQRTATRQAVSGANAPGEIRGFIWNPIPNKEELI